MWLHLIMFIFYFGILFADKKSKCNQLPESLHNSSELLCKLISAYGFT